MLSRPHGPPSWLALLATLLALLSPAAMPAEGGPAITLPGDGGDAWTFEKRIEGALPDGRPLRRRRSAAGGRERGAGDLP